MSFRTHTTFLYFLLCCCLCLVLSCDHKTTEKKPNKTIDSPLKKLILAGNDKSKSVQERKKALDKAYVLVSKLEVSNYSLNKSINILIGYYSINNHENHKTLTDEALKLSIQLSDSVIISKLYIHKAQYFKQQQQVDSSYKYYYESKKMFDALEKNKSIDSVKYSFDQGITIIALAKLSKRIKDYNNSEALTIEAIKKFKTSGNLSYLPVSYTSLGIISKRLERYDEAIQYFQKAKEYAQNTSKDTLYRILILNNTGTIYKSQQKYELAKKHYTKALSYKKFLSKRPKQYARLLDNLGYVKFLIQKNNDSTLYFLDKAYGIRDSINDTDGIATSYLHYAEYYQAIGNSHLATNYALQAKSITTITQNNTELLQAYQLLAQIAPPKEGITYAMEYIKLNDSLSKRDNLFKNKFARIRYESDTLIKENEEKNQRIAEVRNRNTIYLLGITLLLTGIGFIVYIYRQRTQYLAQQNKIVQFQTRYDTETRISKRLHDELGNDIFQILLQYQNNPHDPNIIEKLNNSYTKARDISRENSEFELDERFQEELVNMLQNYAQQDCKLVYRGFKDIDWDDLDTIIKINVYRVLQELMTNMQKHSQATIVALVFSNTNNLLHIKYSDNGIGISQEALQSKNGLRNTEKRIHTINGTIIFDTQKEKGFTANIQIPI